MSIQLGKLISLILRDHFGEIVEKVGKDLFRFGSKTIPLIAMTTELPRTQIKNSLCALIKYGLVMFEPSKNGISAEYKICTDNILALMLYPKYIMHIKNKLGTEAELIVEELLQEGPLETSKIILNIMNKTKDDKERSVTVISLRDSLMFLINSEYLHGIDIKTTSENLVDHLYKKFENASFTPPAIDVRQLSLISSGSSTMPIIDDRCWYINFLRFHRDFRDDLLITAMTRSIDECGGELMKHLLQIMCEKNDPWVAKSNLISFTQIEKNCQSTERPLLLKYLEQYLMVLEEMSDGIVKRDGEAGDGQYVLKISRAAELFVWDLLFSTVQERLGTKAARVFRLIKSKKYIEEEDIQRNAMLPAKEAKQLTYKLLEEHFIEIQALRKSMSTNAGPSKVFYLYYIDLKKVSHMLFETTYKALYNIISRREYEKNLNKQMIEKQQRVDTIVHNLRLRGESEENIRDIEETVTPPEKVALKMITSMIKKLSSAEIQLFDTMFILQLFFMYQNKYGNSTS